MTKVLLKVSAVVVDDVNITFYDDMGKPHVIPQTDPRGVAAYQAFIDGRKRGEKVVSIEWTKAAYGYGVLSDRKPNPLLKFFRARLSDVKRIFGSSEEATDIAEAERRIREISAKLHATSQSSPELPIREIKDPSPLAKDETIIAVTPEGLVPGVENLTDQYQAAEEGKASNTGPDNLLIRLSKVSSTRGHSAMEALTFLKKLDLSFLDDGSFLAYKRLRQVSEGLFVDPYSGKVFQRLGDTVCMDESLIDPSRRTACSTGLHVGSRHYMGGFYSSVPGSATFLILVQPEDVIAVPYSEQSKMRVSKYVLLANLNEKAHNLVNKNKPVDECDSTIDLIAQIVAGARPPMLGEVRISGPNGSNLTYTVNGHELPTNTSYDDAMAAAKSEAVLPSRDVTPVRTIREEKQGSAESLQPKRVYDPKARVDLNEAKNQKLRDDAAQFYARMTDKDNTDADRRDAAKELKTLQEKNKVSWAFLNLPALTSREIEDIFFITEPKKAPVKKPAPAKKKVPEQKATPKPQPAAGSSRQEQASTHWKAATSTSLSALQRKEAAQRLRELKRKAKVSWETLGLDKAKTEATLKKLLD